jgi:hypothetical protein
MPKRALISGITGQRGPDLAAVITGRYVQYGSGPVSAPKEWANFDASMTLKWERIPLLGKAYTKNACRFPENTRWGDIVRGLPVPEESCDGVFASHVLEHLTLADFHTAIENTKRILRRGGVFRLIVPDLQLAARTYLGRLDRGETGANHMFLASTMLGEEHPRGGLGSLAFRWFNTSSHRWMWDAPSLKSTLGEHGFTLVRKCEFGDSEDPMFSLVEDAGRYDSAVAIEARR